jgi:hypothetical protein
MKKIIIITSVIAFLIIVVITGFIIYKFNFANNNIYVEPVVPQPETLIEYQNTQYGFNFSLPLSWKGYSIIVDSWEGHPIDTQNGQVVKGPEIFIRHPLWTSKNPRQDIPIMIFTPIEWDLVQQEKISLGAAPIGPQELGHNSKYIFALPARYNYAFITGFEEVAKILEGQPLHTF